LTHGQAASGANVFAVLFGWRQAIKRKPVSLNLSRWQAFSCFVVETYQKHKKDAPTARLVLFCVACALMRRA